MTLTDPLDRKSSALLVSLWALATLTPLTIFGDEVMLRNGDRLTGKVIRQADGQLELETSYAGIVTIDWSAVQDVKLDEPAPVLLEDDSVVAVSTVVREERQVALDTPGSIEPVRVDPEQVRVIRPEPWEIGARGKISGSINVGFDDESGNSESRELDLDATLRYRRRWHELETFGQLEYDTARGVTTTDHWTVLNKYTRRFPETPWYAAFWLRLKQDRFADIRFRSVTGPALGYQFDPLDNATLSAEIGPIYLYEDFYDTPDNEFWGPGFFIDYEQDVLSGRLQFYLHGMGFSAADQTGKDLWMSWTGLRVPLIGGFVASLEYQIDYDSEPAVETRTTDTTLRVKLGYEW
jgi:putative salt-induced outer membrane protein YdiY